MASKEHWEHLNSGAVKTYTTAKELWEAAMGYFQWCKDNPNEIEKKAMTGKEIGKAVIVRKQRPYTVMGLCLHCGIVPEYLKDMQKIGNKDNEFYHVVTSIINLIRVQNIEMAMIDEYNPIFTAKMLGLEKEEVPTGAIKVTIENGNSNFQLANSENQLLEKIKEENEQRENYTEQ